MNVKSDLIITRFLSYTINDITFLLCRVQYILGYKGRGQSGTLADLKDGTGLAGTSAGLVSMEIRCAITGK